VVLTSPATGLKRELTTNAEGGYDFEALTPGQYTLVFESGNFATYTVTASRPFQFVPSAPGVRC